MDAVPVLGSPRDSTRIGTLRVRVRGSTHNDFGVYSSGNRSRDVFDFAIADTFQEWIAKERRDI